MAMKAVGATVMVAALCALAPALAQAQVVAEPAAPYPDPSLFARGLFLQGEAGVVIPIGVAHKAISAGPAIGVQVGYELARFVALQLHGVGSTHGVDVEGGPQLGQLLQILQASAELKLAVPLGAWSVFAQGGAGRARLSSNVLATAGLTEPGVRNTLIYGGSGGIDYHTQSRHFACGLTAGFTKLTELTTTGAVSASLYLRYTF
jgi:hypothetical protein